MQKFCCRYYHSIDRKFQNFKKKFSKFEITIINSKCIEHKQKKRIVFRGNYDFMNKILLNILEETLFHTLSYRSFEDKIHAVSLKIIKKLVKIAFLGSILL